MNEHNEDFAAHCAGIVAAYNGDEAMRKRYPHWESQYRQLKQLFTKPITNYENEKVAEEW